MSGPPSPTGAAAPLARPGFSSRSSGTRPKASLSLDLSNLPPFQAPTPPSNTLLFTNLQDPAIFRPDNLQTIRELVAHTAPVHSWAPLRSFRRIVVSFFDEDAAIRVRSAWDGEAILGERCRVYFGQPTPLDYADAGKEGARLALPDAGKLFFISPPPSPPHDWEMRLEGAPNKQAHADDLADALSRLRADRAAPVDAMDVDQLSLAQQNQLASPMSPLDSNNKNNNNHNGRIISAGTAPARASRSRSSTLIFHPEDHGSSPDLPAIAVEDMTDEPEAISPMGRPILAHTARPPVELMNDA